MTGNIQWNGDQIIDEVENRIWNNMLQVAQAVVQAEKILAPKKTGWLASTSRFEAERANFAVTFKSDAPYDIFVEYGTRHMMPRAHWRPALNSVGPQYGFDFTFAFDNVPEIHAPVLAAGATFRVPKTLTPKQRMHVQKWLKPVSQWHHHGNVQGAHLRVRGRRHY